MASAERNLANNGRQRRSVGSASHSRDSPLERGTRGCSLGADSALTACGAEEVECLVMAASAEGSRKRMSGLSTSNEAAQSIDLVSWEVERPSVG
jgi:hypothetical protein